MIVSQVSELLFSHELVLRCLGETGLQASASEWEHEKEEMAWSWVNGGMGG